MNANRLLVSEMDYRTQQKLVIINRISTSNVMCHCVYLHIRVRGPCSDWQLGQWYLSMSVDWCSSIPTQLKTKMRVTMH